MEDDVENGEHERKYDQNKYARKSERERKRACQAHKAPATLPSHRLIGRPGVRPGRPNLVRAPSLAAGQVVRDVTAASRDRGRWSPQPASQRERGGRAANKEPRGWVDQYKLAQRRRSRASRRRVTIEVAPSFSNVLALSVYPSPSKQRTTKELQISLRNSQEPTHTKLTRYNNNVPLSCFHQRSSRAIHFCVSSDAPKNGNFFFLLRCFSRTALSLPATASQPARWQEEQRQRRERWKRKEIDASDNVGFLVRLLRSKLRRRRRVRAAFSACRRHLVARSAILFKPQQ